ncbi:hypothetical protein [Dokdonella sp.]|uniref:hypothetical protein n=1 Tax=Dokdonella sp. TaxID=2291710 RepID=UPI0025C3F808|nr:hypothetical protein [Dokdonella sp.]MBX3689441.1 hypothetical protein [Dokdonella sp.]
MNELELQRQLQAMRIERQPQHDPWPAIAQRISAPDSKRPRRRAWHRPALALAACLPLALAAAALAHRWLAADVTPSVDLPSTFPLARSQAPNQDPRLLAGAIVLDAAQAQIEQALRIDPDHPLLRDLLKRTQTRRDRLEQFGHQTG